MKTSFQSLRLNQEFVDEEIGTETYVKIGHKLARRKDTGELVNFEYGDVITLPGPSLDVSAATINFMIGLGWSEEPIGVCHPDGTTVYSSWSFAVQSCIEKGSQ